MNKRWINIVSFIASNRGHKDIIEYLLTKGADINVKAIYGWTPLHYGEYILNIIPNRWINIVSFTASRWNHKIIFEYLVSKGADVNVKDKFGDTPLHLGEQWLNITYRRWIYFFHLQLQVGATRILLRFYCHKVLMSMSKIIMDRLLYIGVNKY